VWSVKFFRDLRSLTPTRLAYISRAPPKLKLPIAPSNAWPMKRRLASRFVDRGVHVQETLGGFGRFEALHFPLPPSHDLVRVLGAIVHPQASCPISTWEL
jgi:hypothetical protein